MMNEMKPWKRTGMIIAAWLLVLGGWLLALPGDSWGQKKDPRENPIEVKAPDFVLKDTEGKFFQLSAQRGKPVLIMFTTTWCSYCRTEIPHFKKLYEKFTAQGLVMVNVDIQEPRDKVARFASQQQFPYRSLVDETGDVANIYEVLGVPTLVLVNKDGIILCRPCRTVDTVLDTLFKK